MSFLIKSKKKNTESLLSSQRFHQRDKNTLSGTYTGHFTTWQSSSSVILPPTSRSLHRKSQGDRVTIVSPRGSLSSWYPESEHIPGAEEKITSPKWPYRGKTKKTTPPRLSSSPSINSEFIGCQVWS